MPDPTYDKKAIEANQVWHLAWVLSEIMNDGAPIGWGKYVYPAECLMNSKVWKERTHRRENSGKQTP